MKRTALYSLIAIATLGTLPFIHAEAPPATAPGEAVPGKPHGPKDFGKGFGKPHDFRDGFNPQGGKGGFEWGQMLQLTPEQKEKVKAIMEAQKPKFQAIREEQQAKMKAVFEDMDKQIRPLLTEQQIAVLDNAKKLRESEAALRQSQPKPAAPEKK